MTMIIVLLVVFALGVLEAAIVVWRKIDSWERAELRRATERAEARRRARAAEECSAWHTSR